jgi:hypothetical protein
MPTLMTRDPAIGAPLRHSAAHTLDAGYGAVAKSLHWLIVALVIESRA